MEKDLGADPLKPIYIALLGAECTGKTELLGALVQRWKALNQVPRLTVIPELLRSFCEQHARAPTQSEQHTLFAAQVAQQLNTLPEFANHQRRKQANPILSIVIGDCAPITTALYSQMYFNDHSLLFPASQFHASHYDLHLVLEPEFAWEADPLPFMRDGPAAQAQFNRLLQDWLQHNPQLPTRRLSGDLTERVNQVITAIIEVHARGPA